MATLVLPREVLSIIATNAHSPTFHSTAKPIADGLWAVPVDDDVMQFIEQRRFAGETDAEVVLRLLVLRSSLN